MDPFKIDSDIIVTCPHCQDPVLIAAINCQIFRHASYKINGEQIPPHTCQTECEKLVNSDSVYGCGRPFRIIINENKEFIAVVCAYI